MNPVYLIFGSSFQKLMFGKFVMKARYDGNSELVAELVTINGFKAAYAIKDGAEGPRGWMVLAFLIFCYLFNFLHPELDNI